MNAAYIASVTHPVLDGQVPISSAYLPDLPILNDHASSPSQLISPTYTVSPAPMGIADYGVSSSGTYTLYTPDVLGTVSLQGYNASAGPLYEDTGAYLWSGLSPNAVVTPWQSGIQLNTVVTNVSYPGSNQGQFWTQNVVDVSGGSFQLLDNVWNFSAPLATMMPGTLYSYNGTLVPNDFYYSYGPTFPLAFPLTIQLYNNASNNSQNRTQVTFGYNITAGALHFSGIYDTVVFNSMPNVVQPLLTPDYQINGTNFAPISLLDDAELIFGGPGAGSNAVINALNGSLSLSYLEGSSWIAPPATYDYGADTGESSIGIASSWTGTTENVTQGPSILYGLWNTTGGAASGSMPFVGHLQPTYGFAFIGLAGTNTTNLSYAPSEPNGTVETWLPPSVGAVSTYNVTAFADGFAELNASFSGRQTDFDLGMSAAFGTWNAPLYMNGPDQAASLALNATGSSGLPYTFNNLSVDVNLTFNHLNHFNYSEFDLVWANGVSAPIDVTNVTQGPDSPSGATLYAQDNASAPYIDLPGFGDEIAVWSGANDVFANLTLAAWTNNPFGLPTGGAVSLWNTTDAVAFNITSAFTSFGIWAADSPGVSVINSTAVLGGIALTVLASPFAFAYGLSAYFSAFSGAPAVDVVDMGGTNGEFVELNATHFAEGFQSLWANRTVLLNVTAIDDSVGASLTYGVDTFATGIVASGFSSGIEGQYTVNTTVEDVSAVGSSSPGVGFFVAWNTSVTGVYVNGSEGVVLVDAFASSVSDVTAVNQSLGVLVESAQQPVSVNLVSANFSIGVVLAFGFQPSTVTNVIASDGAQGVVLFEVFGVQVSFVGAESNSVGVNITASGDVSVSNVAASDGAMGVEIDPSQYVTVSNVSAEFGSFGVLAMNTTFLWVNNTSASYGSFGVAMEFGNWSWITNTSAFSSSLGVGIAASNDSWVNWTMASEFSIGVLAEFSSWIHVLGVTATDTTYGTPWSNEFEGFYPVSAVLTIGDSRTTVENVVATLYPAGLFDNGSTDLNVQSLNASGGDYGVLLNGTFGSTFSGIGALDDQVGVQMNLGASFNLITASSFVGSASYGVDIESGFHNYVYLNNFVGNNGATATYSAAHIQAFSGSSSNVFNSSSEVGNYWADWHSYTNGVLNPYYVSNGAWDYHPIGPTHLTSATYTVSFAESGLAPATSWSVWFNGVEASSSGSTITFSIVGGTYAYSVVNPTNYAASPSSGSVAVAGNYTVPIVFSSTIVPTYTVYVNETGLTGSPTWTAIFNGVQKSTDTGSLAFTVPAGTYSYQIVSLAGYSASPSTGTLTVGGNYTVWVAFTSTIAPTYTVYVNETGLTGSPTWTAIFNGVEKSTDTGSLAFTVPAGTYSYQIVSLADYTVSPSTGTLTVGGNYTLWVAFTTTIAPPPPTYTVYVNETGLTGSPTWTAIFNGVEKSTDTGSLAFTVPAGTYSYQIVSLANYTVSPSTGTLTVGGNYTLWVAFTSTIAPTYTVYVNETGLTGSPTWTAIFNGVEKSTDTGSLAFTVPAGTYSYQIVALADYSTSPPTGTLTVGGNYTVWVAFTSTIAPTYTVYVNETGLETGTQWWATFDGVQKTSSATSISFTVAAGDYSYQIQPIANYSASPASGTATVGGTYVIPVAFTLQKYAVTVSESGLSSGTVWSVWLNGTVGGSPVSNFQTVAGTYVTFYVPNGTWTYTIGSVSGYSLSKGTGPISVKGSPTGAAGGFAPSSTPSYVAQSSYNTGFDVALAIGVVALLVALFALLRRPRAPPPPPAAQWQEPPTGPQGEGTSPPGTR